MRILITGVCGFVGTSLVREIRRAHPDWELVGLDNFSRAGSWRNKDSVETEAGVHLFHGDIRSASDLETLPPCDWVLDAAANPSVLAGVDGQTSSRQLVEHNLAGTINLLEYCRRHEAGFILLSTSRVYSIPPLAGLSIRVEQTHEGRNRFTPEPGTPMPTGVSPAGVAESFSTEPPVSLYGSTKVASEHLAREYGCTYGFPVWINRCGVLAGAGQFGHPAQGIFAFWVHAFREGRPLKYIGFDGEGRQVRDCLHPRDLLPLLDQQMGAGNDVSGKPAVVNLAGGLENSMSLAELTRWCRKRYPDSPTGEPESSPENRPFDLPWVVLDTHRAKEAWGWQPGTPIESILGEIAAFADEQPEWLSLTF
ncbi:MAG: NAD-dependent epimerase/dehydratase family protein [Verrucomicrobia bacterium]|jgi:CDP-paratose 2-epimerase|nr:NAD-dependent epimerase/dehydratase family protein [Verrucomicrobiota bacterium]